MPRVSGRPGASLALLDFNKLKVELKDKHPFSTDRDVMSAALYPQVTEEYLTFHENFGPVDKLSTRIFLTGPKVGEEFEVSRLVSDLIFYGHCNYILGWLLQEYSCFSRHLHIKFMPTY